MTLHISPYQGEVGRVICEFIVWCIPCVLTLYIMPCFNRPCFNRPCYNRPCCKKVSSIYEPRFTRRQAKSHQRVYNFICRAVCNAVLYFTALCRKSMCWRCPWWRHQIKIFSALLAICAGNSPVPDEFPAQRPVTRSFDVFFDLRPNKRLNKQWRGWWFETQSYPLWRHCNALEKIDRIIRAPHCVMKMWTMFPERLPNMYIWKLLINYKNNLSG